MYDSIKSNQLDYGITKSFSGCYHSIIRQKQINFHSIVLFSQCFSPFVLLSVHSLDDTHCFAHFPHFHRYHGIKLHCYRSLECHHVIFLVDIVEQRWYVCVSVCSQYINDEFRFTFVIYTFFPFPLQSFKRDTYAASHLLIKAHCDLHCERIQIADSLHFVLPLVSAHLICYPGSL